MAINNEFFLGFVFSIASATLFGVYMIPQKYAKLSPFQFLLSMGIGVFVSTFFLGFLHAPIWAGTTRQILLSYFCGLVWCSGSIGYIRGIRGLGLGRATCVKNTTGIWGTIFGIIILQEFAFDKPFALISALIGSLAIVCATILISQTKSGDDTPSKSIDIVGVAGALYAAIAFAALMIPTKEVLAGGLPIEKYLFYKGQGAFVSMIIAYLIAERKTLRSWTAASLKQHLWAISSGVIWTAAFYLIATGTTLVGLAISWPLNQMSTHFAVIFGVLTNEFDMSRYRNTIIKGILLTTLGVILLALSKT